MIRTKWNMNRFSRGSYSHMPLGSEPKDHDILAEPIPSREVTLFIYLKQTLKLPTFTFLII